MLYSVTEVGLAIEPVGTRQREALAGAFERILWPHSSLYEVRRAGGDELHQSLQVFGRGFSLAQLMLVSEAAYMDFLASTMLREFGHPRAVTRLLCAIPGNAIYEASYPPLEDLEGLLAEQADLFYAMR